MRLLSKKLAQPHAAHAVASLWLEYSRLLGTPTVLSMALATLLHGFYCQLANEAIHWGTAVLIIAISLSMAVAFWRTASAIGWATGCGILGAALLVNSWRPDVCEVHQGFLAALCGLCAGTWLAAASSRPSPGVSNMPAPDDPTHVVQATTQVAMPLDEPETAHLSAIDNQSIAEQCIADRHHSARGKWLAFAVLLGVFVIYMVVVPVVAMLWEMWTPRPAMRRELTEMSLAEYFRLHTVSGVIMVMFLAIGASVGSFLNVVIFRLPRRRALLWPPSACAACDTRIAGRDNIPVLAWLNLGGRCRQCGVAIAARYPCVEALVAAVFVLFLYRELLSGGENLPVRTSNVYNGIVWILFYTKWDLLTLYIFHMLMLTLLFSWGMINLDRFHVPKRTIALSLLCIWLLLVLAPHLNPLLANVPPSGARQAAAYSSLLGCAVGGLLGWGLALGFKTPSHTAAQEQLEQPNAVDRSSRDLYGQPATVPVSSTDMAASLAVLGAAMGYKAALCVAVVTTAVTLVLRLVASCARHWPSVRSVQTLPITLVLFPVAVLQLVFWKSIHALVQLAGLP